MELKLISDPDSTIKNHDNFVKYTFKLCYDIHV